MKESKVSPLHVQAGAGVGVASDPAPTPAARAAMSPLRFMSSEELGIPGPLPRFGLRACCNFVMPLVGVIREGRPTSVRDLEDALHFLAYGICTAEGWVPDAEELRRRALEALQILVAGDDATVDKVDDAKRSQIARVLALTTGVK